MLSFGPADDTAREPALHGVVGPPWASPPNFPGSPRSGLGDDVIGNCTVPFSVNAC
jgi:hypothetical protein